MVNQWLRLWHDMPTDPKWRTIAKVSGERIGDIMAVYVHLLVCASNATERGRTQSFNNEDVATALDLETAQVEKIVTAMQGRVLDGDKITGWNKRQPKREDSSAERARQWRENQKAKTQPNATERKVTPERDKDSLSLSGGDKDGKAGNPNIPAEWVAFAKKERPDLTDRQVELAHQKFVDYCSENPKAVSDYDAAWRKWILNEKVSTFPAPTNRSRLNGKDWKSTPQSIEARARELKVDIIGLMPAEAISKIQRAEARAA